MTGNQPTNGSGDPLVGEILDIIDRDTSRYKVALGVAEFIRSGYIAKEAVDAVLQEDIEIFEDVPENTRLRLLQLGHNLGVKDFRTALNLDSGTEAKQ